MDRELLSQSAFAQAGLLSWRQLAAAGMPRHRLRVMVNRGQMRRYVHGVYIALWMAPKGPEAERSRAAWAGLLATDPVGVSSGACALHLHGVQGLPKQIRPEVAAEHGVYKGEIQGVRVRQLRSPFECYRLGEWRIAAPVPAMVQALPELPIAHGVCVLDSALNRNILQFSDIPEIQEQLRGRPGSVRLSECWSLIDGRADSPMETLVRLECTRAGLAPSNLQVRVTDTSGQVIARGDLGWLRPDGTWVLVEVDGFDVHSTPTAVFQDRARQNRIMLSARHTTLRFTVKDLGTGIIPAQIRAALEL